MAEAKMEKKAKKNNDKKNSPGAMRSISTSASPPKYSKAARRFYNQHIKHQSQRLSKVLAASGGKFFAVLIIWQSISILNLFLLWVLSLWLLVVALASGES